MIEQTLFPDATSWAKANFSTVQLGLDCRRNRLIYSVTQIAQKPGASFPDVFKPRDLRCFYNLMHRPEATHAALIAGHFERTKQAMRDSQEVILIIHDGTELDFTSHPALYHDLGPIGDGGGRGLLQHNSLAVRAGDGLLLGLAHQQLVVRQPAPRQTSSQRQHRQRESRLWKQGFEGIGRAPAGCCWVDVCDRGGDVFEALHAAVDLGHQALIRACQDRCVQRESTGGDREPAYLMQLARGLPGQAEGIVEVTQKGGRPARTARVKLAACSVRIEPPQNLVDRQKYRPIAAWVERIWEAAPPEGVEPLEWVLVSTLPVRTAEELFRCQDWYARRWTVAEDFHQAEKTGCREEKVRFQDGQSLAAVLAVLSVLAVRVLQLRQVARACPEEPAERVAEPAEIELVQQTLGVKVEPWTIRQFVRGVAMLGGFLGRKCDGEPGWKTLWRGYKRLQTMLEGIRVHAQFQSQRGRESRAGVANRARLPPKP
jgi:hypothetical protein